MSDRFSLSQEDIEFLLQHLKTYIKDKDGVLKECVREDEKVYWDKFFRVTESKEVLKRVEEMYNNAKISL